MNVINFPTPTFSHLDAARDGSDVLFSYADKPVAAIGRRPFDTVEKAPRMGARGRSPRAGADPPPAPGRRLAKDWP